MRLLEGLEDNPFVLLRAPNAGIRDFKRDDGGRPAQNWMITAPSRLNHGNGEAHTALLSKLEGVRKQVLEYLLHTFGIGDETLVEPRIGEQLKVEIAIFRFMAERTADHVEEAGEEDFFGFDGNGSGFDLGKVQDVTDQI